MDRGAGTRIQQLFWEWMDQLDKPPDPSSFKRTEFKLKDGRSTEKPFNPLLDRLTTRIDAPVSPSSFSEVEMNALLVTMTMKPAEKGFIRGPPPEPELEGEERKARLLSDSERHETVVLRKDALSEVRNTYEMLGRMLNEAVNKQAYKPSRKMHLKCYFKNETRLLHSSFEKVEDFGKLDSLLKMYIAGEWDFGLESFDLKYINADMERLPLASNEDWLDAINDWEMNTKDTIRIVIKKSKKVVLNVIKLGTKRTVTFGSEREVRNFDKMREGVAKSMKKVPGSVRLGFIDDGRNMVLLEDQEDWDFAFHNSLPSTEKSKQHMVYRVDVTVFEQ